MIFNYDPILGLQYYSCENEYIYLDLTTIPKMSPEEIIEDWYRLIRDVGIIFLNSKDPSPIEIIIYPIISNVPYFE